MQPFHLLLLLMLLDRLRGTLFSGRRGVIGIHGHEEGDGVEVVAAKFIRKSMLQVMLVHRLKILHMILAKVRDCV